VPEDNFNKDELQVKVDVEASNFYVPDEIFNRMRELW